MADISINQALNAYNKASKISGGATGGTEGAASGSQASGGGGSFGDMLTNSLGDAKDVGYKAEGTSLQSIAKKASPIDLVTAITNADLTLQTVVAVRDRMIAAYQDIIKMPI